VAYISIALSIEASRKSPVANHPWKKMPIRPQPTTKCHL
jgi:hypothetical protein